MRAAISPVFSLLKPYMKLSDTWLPDSQIWLQGEFVDDQDLVLSDDPCDLFELTRMEGIEQVLTWQSPRLAARTLNHSNVSLDVFMSYTILHSSEGVVSAVRYMSYISRHAMDLLTCQFERYKIFVYDAIELLRTRRDMNLATYTSLLLQVHVAKLQRHASWLPFSGQAPSNADIVKQRTYANSKEDVVWSKNGQGGDLNEKTHQCSPVFAL